MAKENKGGGGFSSGFAFGTLVGGVVGYLVGISDEDSKVKQRVTPGVQEQRRRLGRLLKRLSRILSDASQEFQETTQTRQAERATIPKEEIDLDNPSI